MAPRTIPTPGYLAEEHLARAVDKLADARADILLARMEIGTSGLNARGVDVTRVIADISALIEDLK